MFYILAAVIILGSLLAVTSQRILRAAMYLFFVLIATAALYFMMGYNFLAAVQLTLYAGGIVVLIIFSVMLTNSAGEKLPRPGLLKVLSAACLAVMGTAVVLACLGGSGEFPSRAIAAGSGIADIGAALIGYGENGYALPFEVISVLLLAAMVAAIVVAKKDQA